MFRRFRNQSFRARDLYLRHDRSGDTELRFCSHDLRSSGGLQERETMRHLFAVALLTVASAAQTLTTTEQVIAAMHERYARNWYRTLTFEQQSITHKPDGTNSTETWQEAMLLPGRLRIDMGEPGAGNGALFVDGREYLYKAGKLVKDRDELNPLLVLGFDVYRQPVDVTMGQLKTLHVDASTTHEEQWTDEATL